MNQIFRKPALSVVSLAAVKEATIPKLEKNITKLITSILGEPAEGPTDFEKSVLQQMKDFAEKQNGEVDEDDSCVILGGEDNELRIYFFVEENESGNENEPEQFLNYQAVYRTYQPNQFYTGKLHATIAEALQSLKK